jgi:hypothetical protein
MWSVSWYYTSSNWNCNWSLCYIMDTCKVNLSPLWISWFILDYCSLSKIIVARHWRDIRQKSVFAMFENVLFFYLILKIGSPLPFGWRLTWVVPLKTTHLVGFISSNECNFLRKQFPIFLIIDSQELSPLISWTLDI